jgi:adenosylcobinamide amidohydrolase
MINLKALLLTETGQIDQVAVSARRGLKVVDLVDKGVKEDLIVGVVEEEEWDVGLVEVTVVVEADLVENGNLSDIVAVTERRCLVLKKQY